LQAPKIKNRMPKIIFKKVDGTTIEVQIKAGTTVMQAAHDNNIDEIVAECGGNCVCATCHCYVNEAWTAKAGPPSEDEEFMLETNEYRKDNSRLGCQLPITDELDGIVIHLPETQY